MMDWSFRAFTIWRVPVHIHWSLALLMIAYLLRPFFEGTHYLGLRLAHAAALQGLLFVHVLTHELGHCWGARRVGEHAERILLWPLGGLAYTGHTDDPRRDWIITIAGPAVTAGWGFVSAGMLLAMGTWEWSYLNPFETWFVPALWDPGRPGFSLLRSLPLGMLKMSVILTAFNLLVPAYPLDGARLLMAWLSMRYSKAKATRVMASVSIPVGAVLAIWGVMQNELLLTLLGIWVVMNAFQLRHAMDSGYDYGGSYSDRGYRIQEEREGFFERRRRLKREREAARRSEEESALRARVDAVLEKVSREGIASLSPEERRILEEASSRFKDRG